MLLQLSLPLSPKFFSVLTVCSVVKRFRMTIDTLFIAGFGGPIKGCCKKFDPCPGEAYCFVSGIYGHNPARKARIDEVAAHYKELGGFSKFNEITEAQGAAVIAELAKRGINLKLLCGYFYWNPYIVDQVAAMAKAGSKEFMALVMAPQQSAISWDGYLRRIQEGLEALPGEKPQFKAVVDPFFDKPGLIEAWTDHARKAAEKLGYAGGKKAAPLPEDMGVIFSVHAVPMAIVKTSPYTKQAEATAKLVAEKLGAKHWKIGYQSQSSDSKINWTEPSLEQAIAELVKAGAKKIIGVPIGFLCDNVEVLYDLGIEGKHEAEKAGAKFAAAEAVNTHPAFIKMLADGVEAKLH
jgi:protoporphyrin/coproporphyrin ferrochelatase